jgi:Uroporphyrinogen decarboxylase (URO-D)
MNSRERLTATLRGEPVDRPAVCLYEINGFDQDPEDDDPFNIYSHPSWKPLLDLAREKSDSIPRRGVPFINAPHDPLDELTTREKWIDETGRRFERRSIRAGDRVLTSLTRRDPDVDTVWTLEHLLKDEEDFLAWLDLPQREFGGEPDTSEVLKAEDVVEDRGLVMIDRADPLCRVASLFSMAEYTIIAMTRPDLMHRALEKVQSLRLQETAAISEALPGRLWRVVGPEYASPPYLPPRLFAEYVTRYDTPMVEAIQSRGGFARIHSHGMLREVLDHIAATGCTGLDPVEPPHQGDVSLAYVREKYGEQMALWGNIEATDLENLPTEQFREKVRVALDEGTRGSGRGFVLMPSACPYGRELPQRALRNYESMLELAESAS